MELGSDENEIRPICWPVSHQVTEKMADALGQLRKHFGN
jgi:hypothetical protein